jgi:hypothetical protein
MDRSHSFTAQGIHELTPRERFDIGTGVLVQADPDGLDLTPKP